MNDEPSIVESLLMGLLARAPGSGYELRKVIQDTPLARYSDSPGGIYPALRRLARRGLAEGTPAHGGRRRQTWQLTPKGRAWLRRWLAAPITGASLATDAAAVELRLAVLSDVLPERLTPFLREYADALEQQETALKSARASLTHDLSPSARLALDLGIAVFRARREWCEDAARRNA